MTQPARRYLHIRNFDRFQNPDVMRGKSSAAPWIKSYTGQLREQEWIELTLAERGLLESLRLAYAANKCRGLADNTPSICRIIGQRVSNLQLKRLNHAGFIEYLPGITREDSSLDVDVDVDEEKTLTADAVEHEQSGAEQVDEQPQSVAARGNEERQDEQPAPSSSSSASSSSTLDDLLADGPPATSSTGTSSSSSSPSKPRPRDPLWDELERVFGTVADRTNAHAKRNRAVADLRKLGADVELVRHAVETYRRQYPGTPLTDVALATHYPQLTVGAIRRATAAGARATFCDFCGGRGGLHLADCPRPTESSSDAEQVA